MGELWAAYASLVRGWLVPWTAVPVGQWPPEGTEVVFVQVLLLELAILALATLAGWAWRRLRPAPPSRPGLGRILRAALLALAVVLLGFQAMEDTLRDYVDHQAPPQWLPHPFCLWVGPPNATITFLYPMPIKLNSMGLREREIPFRKQPGEYRILLTGDSNPFGQGVEDDKLWSRVLEVRLQEHFPDRKITVLNQGMPGYSLGQSWYLFDEVGRRYDPDLVIVGSHRGTVSAEELYYRDRIASSPLLRHVQVLCYRSVTYLLIRKELARLRTRSAGRPYTELSFPNYQDPRYTDYLWRFLRDIRENHRAAVFVGPLDHFSDKPRNVWRRDNLLPLVRSVKPDEPILFVEWLRELPMELHTLSPTDGHFSVAGHRSMAEQFARYIVGNHLVERTRR